MERKGKGTWWYGSVRSDVEWMVVEVWGEERNTLE